MRDATFIGVDLAKNASLMHGAIGSRVRSVPQDAVTDALDPFRCQSRLNPKNVRAIHRMNFNNGRKGRVVAKTAAHNCTAPGY